MSRAATDELQKVLRPIASLLGKCEKALQNVAPGTWQHTMLRENVAALRVAVALFGGGGGDFTRDDLRRALRALSSMTSKTESARAKFAAGTSQHTLQQNRLVALRAAEKLLDAKLAER